LTPLEEEDLPVAKRQRRQAPTSISTGVDGVVNHAHTADTATTDSADDTPTDPASPAALLPIATTSRAPRRPWKPAEDTMLTEAVKKHGNNWVTVAQLVPGRTNEKCRQRWVDTLNISDGKKKGEWSPSEDTMLTEAVKKHGNSWVTVAQLVPGRSHKQCLHRWAGTLNISDGKKKKGKWSPSEDTMLTEAVKKHGNNWVTVAQLVPGRTNEQCYHRWVDTLNISDGKKKGRWSPSEDTMLTEAVKKHGKDWAAVAKLVPGRTNTLCHHRWERTN
jgi:myb proto-oncogene protein